ncbi:hypothetical protein COOONC_15348 [Cooperia oncophora]
MRILIGTAATTKLASGFENDLTLTLEALHQQVDLAAILQEDWNHCKGDEHYVLGGAGEQVLRILRLLRTAEQTAEKIAKLVTRYTLLDRLFEEQVVIGRLNSIHRHAWLNRKHRFEVDSRKVLDWAQLRSALLRRLIEELEKELRKTENRYDNVTTIENQHAFQRHQLPQVLRKGMAAEKKTSAKEITELQEKMKKQEEEMELLKQTLLSIKAQTEAASSTELTVTVDPAEKTRRTVRSEEVPVNDQEYFEKMVREVQGEEEQQGSERVHEEVEQQENEQKARETKPVEELHGRGQQLQRTRRRQASSGDRRLGHYPGSTKHQRRVRSPEKFDNLRRVRRSVSFEDRIKALRKQADKFEQVLHTRSFHGKDCASTVSARAYRFNASSTPGVAGIARKYAARVIEVFRYEGTKDIS